MWDTAGAPERARQAEVELRRFGQGRFEVVSFAAGAESTSVLEDDFHARSMLYRVRFEARVRFLRELSIAQHWEEEIPKHIGDPGWTPDGHRDGVLLSLLLHPGVRAAGKEEDLAATVVFEDLEPGWRFRAFDDSP